MKLPVEFMEYAGQALGEGAARLLFSQIEEGRELTSVRLNIHKCGDDGATILNTISPEAEGCNALSRVGWCGNGYRLPERPLFTLDPLFHCGCYYVQEASSMYMELAFDAIRKDYAARREGADLFFESPDLLDLCAAPGGKTTHISSLLSKGSLLVSNEVIKSRASILAENVAKWGADNIVVTNNDPSQFSSLKGLFDIVVVDAPCSGEGLFRKDKDAVEEWSPANVELCAQRQQRIISDIWPALKDGGYLVYSTCTYNKFENDGNLRWMKESFDAEVIGIEIPQGSGIIATSEGGIQFVPGLVEGEGQFMALLRKPGSLRAGRGERASGGTREKKREKVIFEKGCSYLPDSYVKVLQGDLVKGYKSELFDRIRFIESNLRVILSGIAVATKKGKDYIPHADLALSVEFGRMAERGESPFPVVELSRRSALEFLKKEPLPFPDMKNGYLFLTYMGRGLGFVKNLGNRSNNLLPVARRIRMEINGK